MCNSYFCYLGQVLTDILACIESGLESLETEWAGIL
jgi:hypothetical protein